MVTDAVLEPLMDRLKVIEILGVSLRKLHYIFKRGELPYVKMGRRVMVRQSDLRNYIEAKVRHGVVNK